MRHCPMSSSLLRTTACACWRVESCLPSTSFRATRDRSSIRSSARDPAAGVTTANGQVVNSEGVRGAEVFGKRARWIDYWGKIDGRTVGIAMFDHPANPRHPTWWMARGYGYCAADPFGGGAIGGEAPGTGDMTIRAGESVTFRYRLMFHEGDPEMAEIDARYRGLRRGEVIVRLV